MPVQVHEPGQSVRAAFNYTKRADAKPYLYMYEPPAGAARMGGEFETIGDVTVSDARPLLDQLSLDQQGFVLRPHDSKVQDFFDADEVRRVYYPEIAALLTAETRAEKVIIFDHTIRSALQAGSPGIAAPGRLVHNDYTEKSARRRVADHAAPAEVEQLLARRFMEINVWRPIRGPLEDTPLAVCDGRSVAAADFIAGDLIYRDRVGEHYRFSYNPAHRWFYFPKMRRDEALMLKCFDSREDAPARFTPHSAFDDPTAPENRLPRESIEVRALVFFRSVTPSANG